MVLAHAVELTARTRTSRPVDGSYSRIVALAVGEPNGHSLETTRLYQADPARARYYLSLPGAGHTTPYWGSNQVERVAGQVTLAFFDRYVLGQARSLAGTYTGGAVVTTGGR